MTGGHSSAVIIVFLFVWIKVKVHESFAWIDLCVRARVCWRLSHCVTGQLSCVLFLTGLQHLQLFCLLITLLPCTRLPDFPVCCWSRACAAMLPQGVVSVKMTQRGIFSNEFPLKAHPHKSPHMPPFNKSTWALSLFSPLWPQITPGKKCYTSAVRLIFSVIDSVIDIQHVACSDKPNHLGPT